MVGSWYFPVAAGSVPWSQAELAITRCWGLPKTMWAQLGARASPRGSWGCRTRTCLAISLGTQGTITGLSHSQLASVSLQACRYLQLPPGLQNHWSGLVGL